MRECSLGSCELILWTIIGHGLMNAGLIILTSHPENKLKPLLMITGTATK